MYKVVLVDDEEWGLASLKSAFRWEEHGFEVMFASTDPAAAWTVIQKWNPDVVFCDIRMPGMDGFAVLDEIQKNHLKSRFVIVSGFAEFQYAQEAISKGVYDYLLKPVDPEKMDKFLDKLQEILEEEQFSNASDLLDHPQKLLEKVQQTGRFCANTIVQAISIHMGIQTSLKEVSEILDQNGQNDLIFREGSQEVLILTEPKGSQKKELEGFQKKLLQSGCYVGVSRPFLLGESIENAIREAKCASAGWFLGRPAQIETFRPTSQVYFREYSAKVRAAVSGRKIEKIQELMKELLKSLQKGTLGMDAVEFFLEDLQNTLVRKYNLLLLHRKDLENIGKILKNFPNCQIFFDVLEKSIAGQLLGNEKKAVPEGSEHFRKLLQYVDEHYNEQLQLRNLAEMFFLNMSYCSKKKKKVTGKNFSEYLTIIRMEAAMEMLQIGNETVSQVAEKTGFSDSYYFGKVFKKYFGISPNAV